MTASIDTIRSDFSLLDDWEDRYRYVIELGQDLPPYPEAARDEAHKVRGCASQVWLVGETSGDHDPVMTYQGDSDAHIVRGLVAIVLALYSGRHASEILAIDFDETLRTLGLYEHLSRQRSNGLRSMVQRIRADAQAVAA